MEEMNNNTETRTEEVERQEETIKETADKKEIDYAKLEEIMNKGAEQKKNAIMNSFFQQMGLSEEEIKEAVDTYKTNKAAAEQERLSNTENLSKELESLRTSLAREQLNNAINLSGYELGLDAKTIKAVQKLGDFSQIQSYGKIDTEKVKGAINSVLDEYPNLKTTAKSKDKIVEVGSPESKEDLLSGEDELRKAFGLKPKK